MRRLLFKTLTDRDDCPLTMDRWFARGSVEERPQTPFIVYAVGPDTPALSSVRRIDVEFWVHDERGDYTRIDDILDWLENAASEILQAQNENFRIMTAEWQGRSGDLDDDGFRTATRNSTIRIVGRSL